MAELIDIMPPIEPQALAETSEFSGFLVVIVVSALIWVWHRLRTSRAWFNWQALQAWQGQGATASLWQLVAIVQNWQQQINNLADADTQPVKQGLQQVSHFASQSDKLSLKQQEQLLTILKKIRKNYWRLVFKAYLKRLQQPFIFLWRRRPLWLQNLKMKSSAENKHER